MRTGVGFPSYGSLGLPWTAVTGAWSAGYPLSNVADLINLRRPGVASAAGARSISFILPASGLIGMVALIHHTLVAGDTVRVRLYSNNNPVASNTANLVSDSTTIVPALSPYYPALLPVVPGAAITAMSGLIDITTSQTVQIGAVEVAGFYNWYDTDRSRTFGFDTQDQRLAQPGGIDANMRQWSPRVIQGKRTLVSRTTELDTTWIDFQATMRLAQPFVWLWNADDTTTWPREAFMAKNQPLANAVATADPAGVLTFNFEEHLG
jgi:hypothetical protein